MSRRVPKLPPGVDDQICRYHSVVVVNNQFIVVQVSHARMLGFLSNYAIVTVRWGSKSRVVMMQFLSFADDDLKIFTRAIRFVRE